MVSRPAKADSTQPVTEPAEQPFSVPMGSRRQRFFFTKKSVWWAVIIAHVVFVAALSVQLVNGGVEGDLELYRRWAEGGFNFNFWPGLNFPWVYPDGALLPLAIADIFGTRFFLAIWLMMLFALNFLSFNSIMGKNTTEARFVAAWWWLGVMIVLAPVGLLRLEGFTAPLVIIALAMLSRRPWWAGILLGIATWIKVWPAALFMSMAVTLKNRLTAILAGIVATIVLVGTVVALGGGQFLFSFVTMQTDRNIQLEAPIAAPWLWASIEKIPGFTRFYGVDLATWEVDGPGAHFFAGLMNPLMAVIVAGVLVMLFIARRRGAHAWDSFLLGGMAITTSMIVFNKVGSPQYMLWIVPILVIALRDGYRKWRTPTLLMSAIAVLTTLIFPIFYMPLVFGSRHVAILLTLRNALLVVLLVWILIRIVKLVTDNKPAPKVAVKVATKAVSKASKGN